MSLELKRDRRTLAKVLHSLDPDEVTTTASGNSPRYQLSRVVNHLVATAIASSTSATGEPGERLDGVAERARVDKERADKLAMENEVARGNLLEAEDVERVWVETFTAIKTLLLAGPRKWAPLVIGMTSLPQIEAELNDGVRDCLTRAARDDQGEASDDTAAAADDLAVGGSESATES